MLAPTVSKETPILLVFKFSLATINWHMAIIKKNILVKKVATKRDKGNPTARTSGMEPMPRNK
jgi:hypothetical protein